MVAPSLLPDEKLNRKKMDSISPPEHAPAPELSVSPEVEAVAEQEASLEIPEVPKPAEAQMEKKSEPTGDTQESTPPPSPEPAQPIAAVPVQKDRLQKEIENVLEEDLTDLFLKLPPNKQKEFQEKGEETAAKIRQLVKKSRINARKIFVLIRKWLKVIPGVNKFFLEQEAKIKTDKVILVTEEDRRRSVDQIT